MQRSQDQKDHFFKFLTNTPSSTPVKVSGVPVAKVPHLNEYFFDFLADKDVHLFSAASKDTRHQTESFRLKNIVSVLSVFAEENKVTFDKTASLTQQLKQLITLLSSRLETYLIEIEKTDLLPASKLLAALLKPVHVRELFSLPIQMLLSKVDMKFKHLIRKEIYKEKIDEEKIIAYIHAGANVKEIVDLSIGNIIRNGLIKTLSLILKDKNMHLDQMTSEKLVGVVNLALSSEVSVEKLGAVLDFLKLLCNKGVSSYYILNVLKTSGYYSLGARVAESANEALSLKYYQLLMYLYPNISAKNIASLISFSSEFMSQTALHASPWLLEEYLKLYLKLLKDRPSSSVIEAILSESGHKVLAINISKLGVAGENAMMLYFKVLLEIFRMTGDTKLIYDILKKQDENGDCLGMVLADTQSQIVIQDYENLLMDLVNKDLRKVTFDEKGMDVKADTTKPAEAIMSLLGLKSRIGFTVACRLADTKDAGKINGHLQFLRWLLTKGVTPDQVVAYLAIKGENDNLFGGFLGWLKSPSLKNYLILLMDLLEMGASRDEVYNLLFSKNVISNTQGSLYALNVESEVVQVYHQLLNRLLSDGVGREKILNLLKVAGTEDQQTYQHHLGRNQNASCQQEYHELVLKLIEDIALVPEVVKLLKTQSQFQVTYTHCLAANFDRKVMELHFNLLSVLVSKGISYADILTLLLLVDHGQKNFAFYLASNQTAEEINAFVKLLIDWLDKGAPADSIYNLLNAKPEKEWDFFNLAIRHDDFDLHQYFNLLAKLEKKVTATFKPITMIEKTCVLDEKAMHSTATPCAKLEESTAGLSNKQLRDLLKLKPVRLYDDLLKVLTKIIENFHVDVTRTDLFEHTLLSLVNMLAQPTETQFYRLDAAVDYPFTMDLRLGYTKIQALTLAGKLNQYCNGLAQYHHVVEKKDNVSDKKDEVPDKRQYIHINMSLLMEKIMLSGVFERHLKERFAKNPLQLVSYQVEANHLPNIDFEKQIVAKLIEAMGEQGKQVGVRSYELPYALLNMVHIRPTSKLGVNALAEASKTEYADYAAIVLLKVSVDHASAQLLLTRLTELFKQPAGRIVGDEGNKKVIALSKSLLASDEFLKAFKASIPAQGIQIEADLQPKLTNKAVGILHASSPLLAHVVSREQPEPIRAASLARDSKR